MELQSIEFTRPGRPALEDRAQGAAGGLFDRLLQASRARDEYDEYADLPLRDDDPAPQARDDRPAPLEQDDPPAAPVEATRGRDTDNTDNTDDTEHPDPLPRAADGRDEPLPQDGAPAAQDGSAGPARQISGTPDIRHPADAALLEVPGTAQRATPPVPAVTAAAPAAAQTLAGQVPAPPIGIPTGLETPGTAAKPVEASLLSAKFAQSKAVPEPKSVILHNSAFAQVSLRPAAVVSRPQGTLSGSATLTTQDLTSQTPTIRDPAAGKPETDDAPALVKAPRRAAAPQASAARQAGVAGAPGSKPTRPGVQGTVNMARQKLEGTSAPAAALTAMANLALTSPQAIQPAALGAPSAAITGATTELAPSTPRAGGPPPAPAEQVALRIQKSAAAGQDRITIKLHPAELGRVDVRLDLGEDGLVRAALVVERAETLELLQRDARGLERALQQAGLQLDSGSLSFNLRGGEPQDENADKIDSPTTSKTDAEAETAQAAAPGARHDGVLDLMV